jgi:ribosomal-protein-alanine N-acetyltransferase
MNAVLRPDIRLQAMAESDLDEVLAIERAVYEFPWTWGNFNDSMRAGYDCWTYRKGGALVGYCILMAAAEEAHLLNLSIGSDFQGEGHGRRLLEHVIGEAQRRGARLLFLEVRPSNPAARQLYASRGFRQIGTRRDYYPARSGREDALVLAIELSSERA